ncbi:transposase [Candidatus Bipolaricaulota bacterium]
MRRRYKHDEIIAKLREAEILLAQGMSIPEVARILCIHESTYHRWKRKCLDARLSQTKRLIEVEKENSRIRMQYPT